jgi:hypothetical protein
MYKFLFIIFLLISPTIYSATLPFGTWTYNIYHKGEQVGNAVIKRTVKSRQIQTESEIAFLLDDRFTVATEKIVENGNFEPLSYNVENTYVTEEAVKRVSIFAKIEGNSLYVSDGKNNLKFNISNNFNFGCNILFSSLLKAGLKAEASGTINMYDPSLSATKTIKTRMICKQPNTIPVGDSSLNLFKIDVLHKNRILYSFYADKDGVIHKYEMSLNKKELTLILSKHAQ